MIEHVCPVFPCGWLLVVDAIHAARVGSALDPRHTITPLALDRLAQRPDVAGLNSVLVVVSWKLGTKNGGIGNWNNAS